MKGRFMLSGTQETIRRKPYTPDLTDGQWGLIGPMPVLPEGGRPRTTNMREVLNGIFYQLRSGCIRKDLPRDFPPKGTVRRWLHYFKFTGQYEKINEQLRKTVRVQVGRDEEPGMAIIDSQTVKSARTSGERGYGAEKKSRESNAASSLIRWV
ncbi:MAG: transposase [Planctomycetaceae bacterium]|jgi:putative transposase|nr:transposase [Planctomycetaceae bacterium]